ncbi:MAG: hypothetical protein ABI615_05780 [Chthoniobacterales bacterium]
MKKIFSLFLVLAFTCSAVMAAPLTKAAKDSIKTQVAKDGTDVAKLSDTLASLLKNAPANERAEIAATFCKALPSSISNNAEAMSQIAAAAIKATRTAVASTGGTTGAQTSNATEVSNAILANVNPAIVAILQSAINTAMAAPLSNTNTDGTASADGDSGQDGGDPGVNTAGQLAPSGIGTASSGAGSPGNLGSTTSP